MSSVRKHDVICESLSAPTPADPPQGIAFLLHVVRILLAYGRHLADTVHDRAAAPSFTSIAACFGTSNLSHIVARVRRGILRAAALENVLLARAAAGRDIAVAGSRRRSGERQPAPADPAGQTAGPVALKSAPRPVRLSEPINHADFHMPTLQELERQVRRRPIGRTIVDICLDLAVMPEFCAGAFWNDLFDAMRCYRGSIANLMLEKCRREQAFDREQDRNPTRGWNWLDRRPHVVRQALGFSIGEPPVLPLLPTAAAIGPP